jgi:hypothetical protein
MDGYFNTSQHNSTLAPTSEHWAKSQYRAFKLLRAAGGIVSNAQDMVRKSFVIMPPLKLTTGFSRVMIGELD